MLSKKDLHTPFTTKGIIKLLGFLQRARSEQASPATATLNCTGGTPAMHAGVITAATLVYATAAGAGESMVVDIQKNGVSIMSATYTISIATSAATVIDLFSLIPAANRVVAVGDMLTVVRTYVAGAGTMTGSAVTVEWA